MTDLLPAGYGDQIIFLGAVFGGLLFAVLLANLGARRQRCDCPRCLARRAAQQRRP